MVKLLKEGKQAYKGSQPYLWEGDLMSTPKIHNPKRFASRRQIVWTLVRRQMAAEFPGQRIPHWSALPEHHVDTASHPNARFGVTQRDVNRLVLGTATLPEAWLRAAAKGSVRLKVAKAPFMPWDYNKHEGKGVVSGFWNIGTKTWVIERGSLQRSPVLHEFGHGAWNNISFGDSPYSARVKRGMDAAADHMFKTGRGISGYSGPGAGQYQSNRELPPEAFTMYGGYHPETRNFIGVRGARRMMREINPELHNTMRTIFESKPVSFISGPKRRTRGPGAVMVHARRK